MALCRLNSNPISHLIGLCTKSYLKFYMQYAEPFMDNVGADYHIEITL